MENIIKSLKEKAKKLKLILADQQAVKVLEDWLLTELAYTSNAKSDVQHNKLMKIREFAKACGVPVSTIRYYLRVGKIKPAAKTAGDYMLFSEGQVKEIKI